MKYLRYLKLVPLFAFLLSIGLSACSQPPEEEIMAAEDAFKAAVNAGAEETSPKLLNKAQTLLQEAKMLSEQGHYSQARKKAEFALLRADQAKKNAERLEAVQRQKTEEDYATEPEEMDEEPIEE